MKKKLFILKLGGRVITKKSSNKPIFNKLATRRLCHEIKFAQKKSGFDLILIHGAGSFGHPSANKYRLNDGLFGKDSARGIAITKYEVLKLNTLVIEEMINSGLNACLVETSAVASTDKGRISSFNINPILGLLKMGIIPVLSGDVVEDKKQNIAILSGDQITTYLAKTLKANKIIFVSDVDGIYDKNPKVHKDAKLIREITEKTYKEVLNNMAKYNQNDTTGEMRGKIEEIKIITKSISTLIVSGLIKKRVENALVKNIGGTKIKF